MHEIPETQKGFLNRAEGKIESMTEEELWQKFLSFEQRQGMDSWLVSGAYPWKLVRHKVFDLFLLSAGMERTFGEDKIGIGSKLSFVPKFLFQLIFTNPYFSFRSQSKPLIIMSSREQKSSRRVIDTLIDRPNLARLFDNSLILFTSRGSWGNFISRQKAAAIPNLIGRIAGYFTRVRFNPIDDSRLEALLDELEDIRTSSSTKSRTTKLRKFHLEDLRRLVAKEISSFKGLTSSYLMLFRVVKPETVYLMPSYSREGAIHAARKLGITVLEFQHGYIGPGQPGYDFEGWDSVPYFPDILLVWGAGWLEDSNITSHCRVEYIGPTNNHNRLKKLSHGGLPEKKLLVISQGMRSTETIDVAIKFSTLNPDWQVQIKAHPKENLKLLQNRLVQASANAGSVTALDSDILSAVQGATVVIGENSTALVEAMLAGRPVVLFKGRYRVFQRLKDSGKAPMVSSAEQLSEIVSQVSPQTVEEFFGCGDNTLIRHKSES